MKLQPSKMVYLHETKFWCKKNILNKNVSQKCSFQTILFKKWSKRFHEVSFYGPKTKFWYEHSHILKKQFIGCCYFFQRETVPEWQNSYHLTNLILFALITFGNIFIQIWWILFIWSHRFYISRRIIRIFYF